MSQQVSPDAPKQGTTLSYLPALDGIRGVAMIGILGVHAEVYLTAGGFYLLDSFFALSGFLITSLLIVEWRKSGTVKLKVFWARRARRLLPALFVMLIGVAILYGLFVPAGTYATLRGDALSALFYFANWHFIAAGDNYFDQTALTSPLIHMWSLSLEEQFYVVWPLVVLGIFKIWRSLRVLLIVCIVGAFLSALEMALVYNPADVTRVYFGTDTHAQSVLIGASLAVGLAMWADRRRKGAEQDWQARTARARFLLTAIGVAGIAGTAVLCITVHSDQAFAYRGGFFLAAIAASAVLLSVSCAQSSPVAKVLSFTVFTYVGRISYSTYLWHFPLFIFINHAADGTHRVAPVRRTGRPHAGGGIGVVLLRRTSHPAGDLLHFVPGTDPDRPGGGSGGGGHRPGHHAGNRDVRRWLSGPGGCPSHADRRRHSAGLPAHPRPGASRR